jgi:hypothetical protein
VVQDCWYVHDPGGDCSVRETYRFSNGQSVNVFAKGNFTVYRPKMVLFTNYPPFIPMLTNGWVELGLDGYMPVGENNFVGQMNFKATVETKTNFSGTINWTQLNWRNIDFVPIQSTTGFYLDNDEFFGGSVNSYRTNSVFDYTINFIDNPGISTAVWPNVNISDHFQTYLRFKPDGDGIWTTLGYVVWGWSEDEWFGTTLISTNVTAPAYYDYDGWIVWTGVTHSSAGQ